MRASLVILILCAAICRAPGQTIEASQFPSACDAVFAANVDPLNPMIIHFQDESSGQISLWQWSFGDGATTTVQNPVHTYATGGTYFVCLTVSSSDSGNICHDVQCTAITIHEPGTCIADYQYTIDPIDRMKTHFTDKSSGNINGWHWDFGDGSFSDERNPIHSFATYGKFRVCLMAYNVDSVSTCNDVKCDSVALAPPLECHALFTSELDSLNRVPNTFIFKNLSTGDPNRYLWKFEGGTFYETRDVIHHFQSPGLFQVCLVIKREEHGEIVCSDSLCQTIETAKYFDLGGHLFIGEYPINNPVSTGDTGVACLFRIAGTKLIPYDTSSFTAFGYYTFPKILNGTYTVKASLTPGSLHYSKYFPGYCQDGLSWKEAQPLDLSQGNAFVSDIHLSSTNDTLTGPGVIRGMVQLDHSKGSFIKIPYAEVLLFDAQMKPLLFAVSDKSGQFEFNNVPYGAYLVSVEYPGKYSRLTAIWLDLFTPVVDSLHLEVFDHDVTAVPDIAASNFVAGDLFPNPANNHVSLTVTLLKSIPLKFQIKTITGVTIWSGTVNCSVGSNLVNIPIGSIEKGLYLFLIDATDGSQIAVKKLLKY